MPDRPLDNLPYRAMRELCVVLHEEIERQMAEHVATHHAPPPERTKDDLPYRAIREFFVTIDEEIDRRFAERLDDVRCTCPHCQPPVVDFDLADQLGPLWTTGTPLAPDDISDLPRLRHICDAVGVVIDQKLAEHERRHHREAQR
jgi:hypothetical protein